MSNYRARLRIRNKTRGAKYEGTIAPVVASPCKPTNSKSSLESNITSDSITGSSDGKDGDHLLCHSCKKNFTTHTDLHAHIALQHSKTFVTCSRCEANSHTLWRSNVCPLCGEFALKLNEHESMHYRDKDGVNALFECSKCYKSFRQFNELKQHLTQSHGQGRAELKAVKCAVCSMKFYSRHARDQHFVSHFKTTFNRLWQNICAMHENFGDLLQTNECPLCENIMTTKRGLRRHVINRHLLESLGSSEGLVDELTVVKHEEPGAVSEVSNAINSINTETMKVDDEEPSGFIKADALKEVKHKSKDAKMELNEGSTEEASAKGCSTPMENDWEERREMTALENGCQNATTSTMMHQHSHGDRDSRKESIEEVQPFDRHQIGVNKNFSNPNSVMFLQSRNNLRTYRSSLNESTVDATLHSKGRETENKKRDNETKESGVLDDPQSNIANDMRQRLIALYLDRNTLSPRCIRCNATFARMFDFEVHLIRTHISSPL